MKVAILGAGIAGLAAARELASSGVKATVYEATDKVGGRCKTVVIDGYTFDIAAISLSPRGMQIEKTVLEELKADDLFKIERPIYSHDGKRTFPTNYPELDQYCFVKGMERLPTLLADGCDIKYERKIESIQESQGVYNVDGDSYDAIIITTPTPEAMQLVGKLSNGRKPYNTHYRSCISVLLGFAKMTDVPYHAVMADDSAHPLNRLSIESLKSLGRAPEGHTALTVLFGPKYSKWHFENSEDELVKDALIDVGRILGSGYENPTVRQVHRWQNGLVETNASFSSVNPAGSKIIVAGDGVMGSRIEYAYDSGIEAAKLLIGQ